MIREGAYINVADNSGAKRIRCFRVTGGSKKRYARIGDIFTASVRDAAPGGKVKKGEIVKAILVRSAQPISRNDGTRIRFDENAAVIINNQGEPIGTRIFGPIARELRAKQTKIISLAPEVL